jgi:hypothetical protein
MYENVQIEVDGPVWTPFEKSLSESTIAVLSSSGVFLRDTQEPYDVEREKREPTWGDPTWRLIPRDISQDKVDATHLHINTDHVKQDIGVAMGFKALAGLETEKVIGRLASENYSVMGYQENGCEAWQSKTGPEIVKHLKQNGVDALLLAPV